MLYTLKLYRINKGKGENKMVTIVDHPLIKVKLAIMRDERTKSKEFRENLDEIASLMCFEVFKDLKTHENPIVSREAKNCLADLAYAAAEM